MYKIPIFLGLEGFFDRKNNEQLRQDFKRKYRDRKMQKLQQIEKQKDNKN